MGTKLLIRNVYESDKDKLLYWCHITFQQTPLRHLAKVFFADYIA
jgi:hypothetical protein